MGVLSYSATLFFLLLSTEAKSDRTHAMPEINPKLPLTEDSQPECLDAKAAKEIVSPGSGGRTGALAGNFTDAAGFTGSFKTVIPADIHTKPRGFLIYLTGDSAADFDHKWQAIVATAQKNGLIPLAVRPPFLQGDGIYRWWTHAPTKANFLNGLLQDLEAKYPVDRGRMVFSGASGGSTFLNGYYIGKHANRYGGGAVSLCGGYLTSAPEMNLSPGFQDRFKIKISIGERDFLKAYRGGGADLASATLKRAGFPVDYEVHRGNYGHCQFRNGFDHELNKKVGEVLEGSCRALPDFSTPLAQPFSPFQSQQVAYSPVAWQGASTPTAPRTSAARPSPSTSQDSERPGTAGLPSQGVLPGLNLLPIADVTVKGFDAAPGSRSESSFPAPRIRPAPPTASEVTRSPATLPRSSNIRSAPSRRFPRLRGGLRWLLGG